MWNHHRGYNCIDVVATPPCAGVWSGLVSETRRAAAGHGAEKADYVSKDGALL